LNLNNDRNIVKINSSRQKNRKSKNLKCNVKYHLSLAKHCPDTLIFRVTERAKLTIGKL